MWGLRKAKISECLNMIGMLIIELFLQSIGYKKGNRNNVEKVEWGNL